MKSLPRVPNYVKLHDALMRLHEEIESSLPEFQELVMSQQKAAVVAPNSPTLSELQLATLNSRKRILSNLTQYDALARRIRDLPLADDGVAGGSQDRLQRAIATMASLNLSEEMTLLRGMGALESDFAGGAGKRSVRKKKPVSNRASTAPVNGMSAGAISSNASDASSLDEKGTENGYGDQAARLAVLLEQEKIVSGYFHDANARRQFEDATALKMSLDELRAEIQRIRSET